jgi:integrase
MSAVTVPIADAPVRHAHWEPVSARAPQLALTAWRYLDQIALSLRPSSVDVADNTLCSFAGYLIDFHPSVLTFAAVERVHIEEFKTWFASHPTAKGRPPARNTIRQRLSMLRNFFERIIEWGWDDAPERTPIFAVDVPVADEPLPRFLDDEQAARLMAAAAKADPLARLVIELLARTGMRVSELCDLEADALVRMDDGWWLRVPVGKLRNDRYVPLHPTCLELLRAWTAAHPPAPAGPLITVRGAPLNRHIVSRMLRRVARVAGLGHVNPHQLRHTLATQAINRGMRLEAIAAMLGHRSLHMTMVYARIANRTVADEYAAAQAQVDALYDDEVPAHLRSLQSEHRRMLGNGWCTRPAGTECSFEAVCEGCGYFQTTIEFRPTLKAQADHARTHDQPARAELYDKLVERVDGASA